MRLEGLNLFNYVEINVNADTLNILVIEEFYYGIAPDGGFADRNFYTWNKNRSIDRLYYGGEFKFYNLDGKNQTLSVGLLTGFNKTISVGFEIPVNKFQSSFGYRCKVYYQENKEIATIPQNNTLQFFSDFENKSQQLFGFDAIVIHRMDYQNNLELNSIYLNYNISNALLKQNPEYLNSGSTAMKAFNFGLNYIFDNRDFKPYPTRGIENKLMIQQGLWGSNKLKFTQFILSKTRFFIPVNKCNYLALSALFQYRFGDLNGINSRQMGYQMDYVRGFEYYTFNGRGALLIKTSWRKPLINRMVKLNSRFIPKNYKVMPFSVWWNINLDGGRLIDSYTDGNNYLDQKNLMSIGTGMDMVMFYDILSRFELTRNNLGSWVFNISFRHAI